MSWFYQVDGNFPYIYHTKCILDNLSG